jgi:hypothetical protein
MATTLAGLAGAPLADGAGTGSRLSSQAMPTAPAAAVVTASSTAPARAKRAFVGRIMGSELPRTGAGIVA